METLLSLSKEKITEVDFSFVRYAMKRIDWNQRLIGITGARGVGKTTLLLQHLYKNYGHDDIAAYVNLDELYFTKNSLLDFVSNFVKMGGRHLYLDEVHKYKNCSIEIKNCHDRYKKLQIIFTGSAALEIFKGEADLSRRALHYHMHNMSFREYLELDYSIKMPEYSLSDIITNHVKIAASITKTLESPLKYFREYLVFGSYPFAKEDKKHYHKRLVQVFNQTIETDMPALFGIDYNSVVALKKLIYIITSIVPYKPNVLDLSRQVGVSRETILRYFGYLSKAEITASLFAKTKGITQLNKPEKIYICNPNLIYALSPQNPDIGAIRETFFFNQLTNKHSATYSESGDFLVDNKLTFEVGGRGKTARQIKGVKSAYIVKDDIEIGNNNYIPLYLFGFLY